jgi:uncharacterized protein YlxW (UPF0749 family)
VGTPGDWARRNWWLITWSVVAVVLGGGLVLATDEPRIRHTSALDSIFDSRWMIAGGRLLAAVLLVYLVASVGVRIKHGEWVRRAGPVETDTQQIVDSQENLQERLEEAEATIRDLSQRLSELNSEYDDALATIEVLRGSGQ